MSLTIKSLALATLIIATSCCNKTNYEHVKEAIALVFPVDQSHVNGTVVFTEVPTGIRVQAVIENLLPGKHGFHIHHYGDTYAHDAASVCAHFNPTHQLHGSPASDKRHVGDMGNITANENGIGRIDYVDTHLKLNGPQSIIGRSVIVHGSEDDFTTQPTGNAGKKIGVGIIGIKNPTTNIKL